MRVGQIEMADLTALVTIRESVVCNCKRQSPKRDFKVENKVIYKEYSLLVFQADFICNMPVWGFQTLEILF